jgi:hypothetical protein
VTVTVTAPGGNVTAGKFSYKAASSPPPPTPRPVVTGISPASGPTAGGTSVSITGTNLSGATGVSFGGAGGSITADSGTKITATSPAGSGTVNITVTTPGGTSEITSADKFTYVVPAPTVTGIRPDSGSYGTTVDILGTNLSGATSVSFGGVGVTISSDSSTEVVVTAPEGKGTVNITVTTAGGTSAITSADQFTYVSQIQ